jgi:hypothetical protein
MRVPAHLNEAVLILSAHVAMQLRLRAALETLSPVECAASEADLLLRLERPVRLVVIHGAPPFADTRLPARIRHAVCNLRAPIVVLASSKDPAWADGEALIAAGEVEDIIHIDAERAESLIAAWSLHRLAHQSAPESLHRVLEELLLSDGPELSVTAWAATKPDGSRFTLRRELRKMGVTPSALVAAARVLNVVARMLVGGQERPRGRAVALPEVRAARRLLARTLGVTTREISTLVRGDDGIAEVRGRTVKAVGALLRAYDMGTGK